MSINPIMRLSLSGNISAGKSTVLSHIKNTKNDYFLVEEPLKSFNSFITVDGTSLKPLEMYYNDPYNVAGYFQLHACESFDSILKSYYEQDIPPTIEIWDRIPHEIDIFTRALYKLEQIPLFGYEMCKKRLAKLLSDYAMQVDHIYYVQTSPDICYERMQKRSRNMEVQYGMMKKQLHYLHQEYDLYMTNCYHNLPCPVTFSKSDSVEGRASECIEIINNFLSSRSDRGICG